MRLELHVRRIRLRRVEMKIWKEEGGPTRILNGYFEEVAICRWICQPFVEVNHFWRTQEVSVVIARLCLHVFHWVILLTLSVRMGGRVRVGLAAFMWVGVWIWKTVLVSFVGCVTALLVESFSVFPGGRHGFRIAPSSSLVVLRHQNQHFIAVTLAVVYHSVGTTQPGFVRKRSTFISRWALFLMTQFPGNIADGLCDILLASGIFPKYYIPLDA